MRLDRSWKTVRRGSYVAASLAGALAGALSGPACGGAPHRPVVAEVTLDGGPLDAQSEPPAPPLYVRLGGKDGVAGIVDSFIDNLMADPRVKKPFAKTTKGPKLEHFKQMLNEQLCELTGGDCRYSGKTMSDVHAGMRITGAQFDAFVSDFQLALDEKQVAKEDAQQVIEQLNLLKDQVVTAK